MGRLTARLDRLERSRPSRYGPDGTLTPEAIAEMTDGELVAGSVAVGMLFLKFLKPT